MKSRPIACPFCGKKPRLYFSSNRNWITCENDSCVVSCGTASYKTQKEAVKAWNTRRSAGWTSVTKPPKKTGFYLVSIYDDLDKEERVFCAWYKDKQWVHGITDMEFAHGLKNPPVEGIRAWMPLPQKYGGLKNKGVQK